MTNESSGPEARVELCAKVANHLYGETATLLGDRATLEEVLHTLGAFNLAVLARAAHSPSQAKEMLEVLAETLKVHSLEVIESLRGAFDDEG